VADIKSRENSSPLVNVWCGVFLLGSSIMGCGADDESIGADVDAGIAVTGTFDVTDGIGSCKGGGAESIAVGGVGA
jgi:hypothetical protein